MSPRCSANRASRRSSSTASSRTRTSPTSTPARRCCAPRGATSSSRSAAVAPHDCAKGIAHGLAANGGTIARLRGRGPARQRHAAAAAWPINTTAGTASEMTRFCIITDDDAAR
ncbi:MAG: iron-containing alcohol dehydrogenase [Comamonadaceae bacterium]|nr:iron-containing alcohol dehydrogenase [Comamonadaceae bacterium]